MPASQNSPCALVTGGARRVGRAIALRLAGAGYDLAVTYLSSADEAATLASEIESLASPGERRRAIAIQADLADPQRAAEHVSREIRQHFGRLDVLVNNASIYQPTNFDAIDLPAARRMWAVHVEAPMLLSQQLAPLLRNNAQGGSIVNMVDLLGERPWPAYMAYCASKAALANLTLSLARQLAPEITVNGIAPGVVEWPDDFPPAEREKYLKRVPLGRAGTPDDAADLVHFLVTRGRYITGQILRLDGGRSIT